jgi:hypothetical protein
MSERKAFMVKTVTAADCIGEMATLQPYDRPSQPIHVLIVAAGFEERVLALPALLQQDGFTIRDAILVGYYRTNSSDNEQRYKELAPRLAFFGARITSFDADDPLETVATVEQALKVHGSTSRIHVAFDISGASSTLILAVMAALTYTEQEIELTVLYASAGAYDVPQNPAESFVLEADREEGVSNQPLSVPFGGHHHDHLPGSVIALPSMYTSRLESCLAHLNVGPITGSPDNLYWLLPSTGVEEHKWRQDSTRRAVEALMLRLQGRQDEPREAEVIRKDDMASSDVLDYASTMRLLIARIDRLGGRNITIVHMGSKLQAIGVALAAAARSEVAVLTARPSSFNAKAYSSGVGSVYTLHFADFGSSLRAIRDIGTLQVSSR